MTKPSTTLESRFLACLRAHAPTGRLIAGFSGGRDSTVLLHLLAAGCPDRDRLAVHVDHGLHPRSGEWAAHCRDTATALGLPCEVVSVSVEPCPGDSVEALARNARHEAFRRMLRPGDVLLTAHHADDQLETMLYRLLRGAGSRGLAGIPFQRRVDGGRLLRPLIDVPAGEIQRYARAHDLVWLEDPSNRDTRFDRNWLRHRVLERLGERWPDASRQAARAARNLAEDSALLEELARDDLAAVECSGGLDGGQLAALSPLRRRNLLRFWVASRVGYPPSRALLGRIEDEVIGAREDAVPDLPVGAWVLRRHRGDLVLEPRRRDAGDPAPGPFHWPDPGEALTLPGNGGLSIETADPEEAGAARLPAAVTVRYRAPGDVFHDGRHHRRVKEWMRLAEIPVQMRDRVPLLLDGERIFAVGETVVDPRYIAAGSGEVGEIVGRIRWHETAV